ncbi:hypothetical protein [Medusavirus stheno T3]|uniref:Uncharacterized protein n=1 Tax=Medusavirus stheno T3 TaxID=3069717 RepID=A0A7S8BEF3_9VIRU|nr:hypothetical protein QKU73_gp001 [Acanthamoeba castellanii medusavirus]QPB44182.1 hypothetical protein [Medusavirus stheno T3]
MHRHTRCSSNRTRSPRRPVALLALVPPLVDVPHVAAHSGTSRPAPAHCQHWCSILVNLAMCRANTNKDPPNSSQNTVATAAFDVIAHVSQLRNHRNRHCQTASRREQRAGGRRAGGAAGRGSRESPRVHRTITGRERHLCDDGRSHDRQPTKTHARHHRCVCVVPVGLLSVFFEFSPAGNVNFWCYSRKKRFLPRRWKTTRCLPSSLPPRRHRDQ